MWKYNYEEGFDLKPFKDCLDRTGIRGHYESDGGLTTAGMGENPHEWPSLVPFLTWLQPKIELTLNEWCINWNQYQNNLPNLELDLIFVTIERFLNKYDQCNVEKLRKKYPNAKIIGFIKEVWTGPAHDYSHPKHISRINFLTG